MTHGAQPRREDDSRRDSHGATTAQGRHTAQGHGAQPSEVHWQTQEVDIDSPSNMALLLVTCVRNTNWEKKNIALVL